MYGAQTSYCICFPVPMFENDVEMYGAQTPTLLHMNIRKFENDVEMYGAQTAVQILQSKPRLRMM